MPKIDKITWGNLWIDGKKYHQVVIVGNKVYERKKDKLEALFGTTHGIGDWEIKQLFSQDPEVILIANGWDGLLKIKPEIKDQAAKKGLVLKIVSSSQIVADYNRLISQGKKVNALIHTTC